MAEDKMNPPSGQASLNASLDRRIILALETAPRPEIPADFAARIAAQLPPRATVVLTPRRYGQRAAMVCLVVLLPLMLAIAHWTTGTSLYWFSIELIFCAQFALVAVWLAASASSF
jgi:hypothetical protein